VGDAGHAAPFAPEVEWGMCGSRWAKAASCASWRPGAGAHHRSTLRLEAVAWVAASMVAKFRGRGLRDWNMLGH